MSHVVCAGIAAEVLRGSVEAVQRSGSADAVEMLESMKMGVPVLAKVTELVMAA